MVHEGDGVTDCKWGLRTIPKGLINGLEELEIRGQAETIQTIQNLSEYREESSRIAETYCHSDSSERPSANAGVKNSKGMILIRIKWIILSRPDDLTK